jgi:small conductance mechanosensitive channel
LEKIVKADKRILKDPATQIVVGNLGDSSVDFFVRPWCKTEDYWDIKFDMLEKVKTEFDKEKISIPYPQMDVHMKKD